MIIAIPIHEDRVMPRFGCTRDIMVISVTDGVVSATKRLTIAPRDLRPVLAEEQVSLVICGGIHPRFQQQLQQQQIGVVWGAVGPWRDVLQAYLNGTLQHDRNLCRHHGPTDDGYRLRHRHQRRK